MSLGNAEDIKNDTVRRWQRWDCNFCHGNRFHFNLSTCLGRSIFSSSSQPRWFCLTWPIFLRDDLMIVYQSCIWWSWELLQGQEDNHDEDNYNCQSNVRWSRCARWSRCRVCGSTMATPSYSLENSSAFTKRFQIRCVFYSFAWIFCWWSSFMFPCLSK